MDHLSIGTAANHIIAILKTMSMMSNQCLGTMIPIDKSLISVATQSSIEQDDGMEARFSDSVNMKKRGHFEARIEYSKFAIKLNCHYHR